MCASMIRPMCRPGAHTCRDCGKPSSKPRPKSSSWGCGPRLAAAEALGRSGELLHIVRVRRQRRTREPLMVTDAWLPPELAPVLTERAAARAAV